MSVETVANIVNDRNVSLFDQVIEILMYLKELYNYPHLYILDEVNECVQKN